MMKTYSALAAVALLAAPRASPADQNTAPRDPSRRAGLPRALPARSRCRVPLFWPRHVRPRPTRPRQGEGSRAQHRDQRERPAKK